ncbi:MAG: hypothetical protein WCK74_00325 [Gemmatimonadaceae bacterium]
MLRLEHKGEAVIPHHAFRRRLLRAFALAAATIAGSLAIGVIGYRVTEGMPWLDALLNAAMILGGMGPVDALHSDAGKLFAAGYALFSGIVFLAAVGVLITPVVHRFYHRFHAGE